MTRRRLLWIALGLLLTLTVLAGILVSQAPELTRRAAIWAVEGATNRAASIEAVELSLATGRFSVRGFRLASLDGGPPLAEFQRLEGRLHRRSLLRLHVWIEELALIGSTVRIVRIGPDEFNISDLIGRVEEPRRRFDITVDHFTVRDGTVTLEDRVLTPARTWTSAGVTIDARNVSTLRGDGTAVGSTTVEGALVTMTLQDLRLVPIVLRAQVNVRDLDLRLAALYLPPDAAVTLERGGVNGSVRVGLDARAGLRLDADAVVEQVQLGRHGQDGTFLSAPEVQVTVRDLVVAERLQALGSIAVAGDISVFDATRTPPARFDFAGARFTAEGLARPATDPARLTLAAALPGGGRVEASGTARLAGAPRIDGRVRLTALVLDRLAPYIPLARRATGTGSADAAVAAVLGATPQVSVTGTASVRDAALLDGERRIVAVERAAASGVEYRWPARVRIGRLELHQPAALVERTPAGDFPIRAFFATPEAAPGDTPAEAASAARTDVEISEAVVTDGALAFHDAAVTAAPRREVRSVHGTVRDFTWPPRTPARLELRAALPDGGTLSAQGGLDLARERTRLALVLRRADLALVQPYLPFAARIAGTVDADVTVRGRVEPFGIRVTGAVGAGDLAFADADRPLITAARVEGAGIDLRWPGGLRVEKLRVQKPWTAIERDQAGQLGLRALFAPRAAATPPADEPAPAAAAAFSIAVADALLEEGSASVVDASVEPPARFEIPRARAAVQNFAWPPRDPATLTLSAALPGGGEVAVQGRVDLARERTRVSLALKNADLGLAQPFLPFVARVGGRVNADIEVGGRREPFRLRARGAVGVSDLAFSRDDRPLLTVARADASGVDVRWPAGQLAIAQLRVQKPWAAIERDPQGQLALRALFAPRPAAPGRAPAAVPAAATAFGIAIADALFEEGSTTIVDTSVEPAARFEISRSRLAVQGFAWPGRSPAKIQLSSALPRGGDLEAQGTFALDPARADLRVTLKAVNLAPVRPYLPIEGRVSGVLDSQATLSATFEPFRLTVRGDASVGRLAFGDLDRQLMRFERIDGSGIEFQWPPRLTIEQVQVRRPWALVERDADGRFALADLLRTRRPPGPGPAPAAAAEPGPGVHVLIGALALEDGFARFVDRTTAPDFAEEISGVRATARGLGTRAEARAEITAQGILGADARFSIDGQIGGIGAPLFLDLTAQVEDFAVPRVNPYLQTLLSWVARQGRLTATLRYHIDGDFLDATNRMRIEQLQVARAAEQTEVEGRIGLPLDLLVSLLKGPRGNIEVTIPVRGQLTAPEFDFSEAVWGAVRNLAIRLVALPFSLVGRLLFTPDSRIEAIQIDPVLFEPGTAAFTPAAVSQVQRLADVLREAPELRIRMRPVMTVDDVARLRRQAIRERLRERAADASPAALHAAAARAYAQRYPARQPPATTEELLAALEQDIPAPRRAMQALAEQRLAAVRAELAARGVAAERLAALPTPAAVEAEGEGRVEFEIGS